MVTNARLIAHTAQTNVTGSGEPVFGVNRLAAPVPCQLVEPSAHQVSTAAAEGVRLETILVVPRRAFVIGGRMPAPGDRMTVRPNALLAEERTGDLIDATEHGMVGEGLLRLRLGQRCDDSIGGAS